MTLPAVTKLTNALKAAGVPVIGVSPLPDGGYKVTPPELQATAQPIIDAFDPNDPAHDSAELNMEALGLLDQQRVYAAIIWVILRTMYPGDTVAQTKTKFNAQPNGARQQVIDAFKARPWL